MECVHTKTCLLSIVAAEHLHMETSLQVPNGDILVFAGDAGIASELQVPAFATWLAELPHKARVVTFGNMDRWAESSKFRREALPAADAILLGESTTAAGFRFTGSPFTPKFTGAFQLESEDHAGTSPLAPALVDPDQRGTTSARADARMHAMSTHRRRTSGPTSAANSAASTQQPPRMPP